MNAVRAATCSVHPCGNPASVPLKAKPPAPSKGHDNVWWFCTACAPAYERMGYEPLGEREPAAQGSLI